MVKRALNITSYNVFTCSQCFVYFCFTDYVSLQITAQPWDVGSFLVTLDTAGVERPKTEYHQLTVQTKYQKYLKSCISVSRVQLLNLNGTSSKYVPPNRKWKIQDGDH